MERKMSDATVTELKSAQPVTQLEAAKAPEKSEDEKQQEALAQRQQLLKMQSQFMDTEIEFAKRQAIVALLNMAMPVIHELTPDEKRRSPKFTDPSIKSKLSVVITLLSAAKDAGDILRSSSPAFPMGQMGRGPSMMPGRPS
jgi:hypothetical protein